MKGGGLDFEGLRESLVRKLGQAKVDVDIIMMHDFFLDHAVSYNRNAKALTTRMMSVASRGGGEIPDIPQSLEVGGNAAITTLSLATLGARVHPIMRPNRLGLSLMKYFYEPLGVDLSHINGNLAPTVILELKGAKRTVNVMIGDLSNVSDFGYNEAILIAKLYGKLRTPKNKNDMNNVALEAARLISASTGVKVHVHTAEFSSSVSEDQTVLAPSFEVPLHRGTGAGDTWNTGNLVGDSLDLDEGEKLLFANAVACRYISSPTRAHSTVEDVRACVENTENKLKEIPAKLK